MRRHFFTIGIACGTLALGIALSGAATPAVSASGGTDVYGTLITQDTVWGISGSPYRIHEAAQIGENTVLRVDPGVKIVGVDTEHLFVVAGTLNISGTASQKVTIDAGESQSIFRMIPRPSENIKPRLEVKHAYLHDSSNLIQPGYAVHPQVTITDSILRDIRNSIEIWYPSGPVLFARNNFVNTGGISIGNGPSAPVTVELNRFQTAPTTAYWVENWQGSEETVFVNRNAFLVPGIPTVNTAKGYSYTGINATNNYWGTTDPSVIAKMALDGTRSLDRAGKVLTDPFLYAIPGGVPPAAVFAPGAPRFVTGKPGSQSVTLSWSAPLDDGGAAVTGYRVISTPASPGCQTTGQTSCTVPGLTNGVRYSFTVSASNSEGWSKESDPVGPFTPRVTVPDAVTNLKATPASGSVRFTWTPPVDTGGSPITSYRVQAGSGRWVTTKNAFFIVQGKKGKPITFKVAAVNSAGSGAIAKVTGTPK